MDSDVAHGRDRSISCREDSWIQIDRDLLAELREQSGIVRHSGSASDLRADPALVRAYPGEHERAT